jgi:hypothetical protein
MLVVCTQCRRHFHHTESSCPFCGNHRSPAARRFGVGLVVAMSVTSTLGCGGESEQSGPSINGGQSNPNDSGGTTAMGGATQSGKYEYGGAVTLYGAPPWGMANGGSDVSGAATGGRYDVGGMMTVYGTPPRGGAGAGGVPSAGANSGGRAAGGVGAGGASTSPSADGGAGAPGHGGNAGAAGSNAIECRASSSGAIGWYQGNALICSAPSCRGCAAICQQVGTRSEGWYTICQSTDASCSEMGLITFARCGG